MKNRDLRWYEILIVAAVVYGISTLFGGSQSAVGALLNILVFILVLFSIIALFKKNEVNPKKHNKTKDKDRNSLKK